MKCCIDNIKIVSENKITEGLAIYIEDGKITALKKYENEPDWLYIDGEGKYASSGFIDIHTHGGGNYDFLDDCPEAFVIPAEVHGSHGTTLILPTTVAGDTKELIGCFEFFRQAKKMNKKGAKFMGLHLEGPYFSAAQRGAQRIEYIKPPLEEEYKLILSSTDDIVRWSSAPELDEGFRFGDYITSKGILCAAGHTDATYEQMKEAFQHGYTHITHLYSGMSTVHRINAYRYAGVVESAYLIDGITAEIIADGSHLPASLLEFVYKFKGPDKTCLITDSLRPAGFDCTESIAGSRKMGQRVIVEDGVAKLPDRSAFAGSIATCDILVRNMMKMAGVPLCDAIKMMTETPAKIMKIGDKKGIIKENYDADIVIFDEDINVRYVFVEGKLIADNKGE